MNKYFYSIVLSLLIVNAKANKTDSLGHSSKLFVNIGINQSNLHNHDLYSQSIIGLEMGAQVLTHWQNNWYSEIGLQYIRKGSAREVDFVNIVNDKVGSYTENIYLHYVQLPILLKKHLAIHKNVSITLGAGIYNALLF
ncbi:MAG: outer membrane beta-barrel protein [Bacteroidota bacterium]